MIFRKKKELFTEEEKEKVVQSIRVAERLTSGEIRVYVETRCRFMDPMHRAVEVFRELDMHKTKLRNAVLLYIALKDRQFAIYGDEAIHVKVGDDFWRSQAHHLRTHLREGRTIEGIVHCVKEIGQSLEKFFPHEAGDENELPDDIVFGK